MDEWIDRALSTYVPAEAPLGLEQRIVARARAPRGRIAFWVAAAAATCAVCVLISIHPFAVPRPAIPATPPEAVLPVRATAPLIRGPSLPRRAIARPMPRRPALPKLPIFPKFERVPDAEAQLARLALNPEIGKALLTQPEIAEPEPIHIAPLSIKLLDED